MDEASILKAEASMSDLKHVVSKKGKKMEMAKL